MNEDLSKKDFTNIDLSGRDVSEFNNTEIVGSCFAQFFDVGDVVPGTGGKSIFPAGMTGVTFTRCNLDNVHVPAGNTVGDGCTNKTIQRKNDLEDWVLKKNGSWEALLPNDATGFSEFGLSADPNDIPGTKRNGKSLIAEAMEA